MGDYYEKGRPLQAMCFECQQNDQKLRPVILLVGLCIDFYQKRYILTDETMEECSEELLSIGRMKVCDVEFPH